MSAHSLAIAKASLSACLLRPDPALVPREEIREFHDHLEAALTQCSPTNIQRCKIWLLKHAIPSPARIAAIGKYLIALSTSLCKDTALDLSEKVANDRLARRKQLHVLYLFSDLLHHTKYHLEGSAAYETLTGALQYHIVELVKLAAAHDRKKYLRQHKRLEDLLTEWHRHQYFHLSYLEKLRHSTLHGEEDAPPEANSKTTTNHSRYGDTATFVMPATHGDPSTPYYDLPASNMMPHITLNPVTPINPQLMKPLQLAAGPAEPALANVVKDFLRDVDAVHNQESDEDEAISLDYDELGQSVLKDKETGDIKGGDSYYGWSRDFCERMKRRVKSSASSGRDTSPVGNYIPHRRRRYSGSLSNRSTSGDRDRSNSPYRRDRSSIGRHHDLDAKSRKRLYSRSCSSNVSTSRSRSPPSWDRQKRHRSRSSSRDRSYSPPQVQSLNDTTPSTTQAPFQIFQDQAPLPPLPISFHSPFPHGVPLGQNVLFIPPPRPSNYTGPWPPPPPPPPPMGLNTPRYLQYPNFIPPPLLPLPLGYVQPHVATIGGGLGQPLQNQQNSGGYTFGGDRGSQPNGYGTRGQGSRGGRGGWR